METLEHRYYFSGKPYLWILAENMPNASADDFHIIRLKRNTGNRARRCCIYRYLRPGISVSVALHGTGTVFP